MTIAKYDAYSIEENDVIKLNDNFYTVARIGYDEELDMYVFFIIDEEGDAYKIKVDGREAISVVIPDTLPV